MRVTLLLLVLAAALPAGAAVPGCTEATREGIYTRTCLLPAAEPCDASLYASAQREVWADGEACVVEHQDPAGRQVCAYSVSPRTWTGACARAGNPAAASCAGGSAFLGGSRIVGTAPCP